MDAIFSILVQSNVTNGFSGHENFSPFSPMAIGEGGTFILFTSTTWFSFYSSRLNLGNIKALNRTVGDTDIIV